MRKARPAKARKVNTVVKPTLWDANTSTQPYFANGPRCLLFSEEWTCCENASNENGWFWLHCGECKHYKTDKKFWSLPMYSPLSPEAYAEGCKRKFFLLCAEEPGNCQPNMRSPNKMEPNPLSRLMMGYHECWFCDFGRIFESLKRKANMSRPKSKAEWHNWQLYKHHISAFISACRHREPPKDWWKSVDDDVKERHYWAHFYYVTAEMDEIPVENCMLPSEFFVDEREQREWRIKARERRGEEKHPQGLTFNAKMGPDGAQVGYTLERIPDHKMSEAQE